PTARRFRTGATLAMYSLIVFVIVLLTQISAIIRSNVDQSVEDASAGWAVRLDYNPSTPIPEPERTLTTGSLDDQVDWAAPLVTAPTWGDDPLGRTDDPVPAIAVGLPTNVDGPVLESHLNNLVNDSAAWD